MRGEQKKPLWSGQQSPELCSLLSTNPMTSPIHIQSVIESAIWIIQVAFIAPESIKASKLVVIDLISDSVWANKKKAVETVLDRPVGNERPSNQSPLVMAS